MAAAEEAAGAPIDILVANAGVTRDGLLMRMKDEDWDTVLKVNLEAYFRLSRAAMRSMMKRRFGRIIGITLGRWVVMGNPGQTNSTRPREGRDDRFLQKLCHQEVASRSITVNCVAPGFIESPMTDALNEAQKEGILGKIPAARLGSGDEVAAAAGHLAFPARRRLRHRGSDLAM